MTSNDYAVEGRQLVFFHKGKENIVVLSELDIHVRKGTIYGLIGSSGCGKTTLLRCMIGQLQPQKGKIWIYGRQPGEHGFCIPGKGIGYMPQELSLCLHVSIEEMLWYFGRISQMSGQQIGRRISFLIDLLKIPNKKTVIRHLSAGQKRRVSFAAALLHKPPLLILDEPTVGVDPILRHSIWNHMKLIALREHTTIIMTTHYIEEARQADKVGLMREGRLLTEMNPEKLMEIHNESTLDAVFLKLSTSDRTLPQLTSLPSESLVKSCSRSVNKIYHFLFCRQKDKIQRRFDEYGYKILSDFNEYNNLEVNPNLQLSNKFNDHSTVVMHHNETKSEKWKTKFTRMNAISRRHFTQTTRNKTLLMLRIVVSVTQMLAYCSIFGQNVIDLPLSVVNLDIQHGLGDKFLQRLDNQTIKQVQYSNLHSAIDSAKSRKSWGTLYIGPNFTSELIEKFIHTKNIQNQTIWDTSFKLYLDMTDAIISSSIKNSISKSWKECVKDMFTSIDKSSLIAESSVLIENPVYGYEDSPFSVFSIPSFIILLSYTLGLGSTAACVLLEIKNGIMERSLAAGVQLTEIVVAIFFSLLFVTILQVTGTLAVGLLLFPFHISYNAAIWVTVCALVSGINGMSLGILISALTDKESAIGQISISINIPTFIFCGILWPIQAMPSYLQSFVKLLPLTLLTETTRSVLARNWDITEGYSYYGLIIPLIWTILQLSFSVIILTYKH